MTTIKTIDDLIAKLQEVKNEWFEGQNLTFNIDEFDPEEYSDEESLDFVLLPIGLNGICRMVFMQN